jgi:hypothetical protein
MAKVTVEITAAGTLETTVSQLDVLDRLFRLGQHIDSDKRFLCVPRENEKFRDLNAILNIPKHMEHFDWRVQSLLIIDEHDKRSVVYHNVLMTQEEYDLLITSFGFRGSCGCDGATSDGCPLCDKSKTKAWKETIDRVKTSFK